MNRLTPEQMSAYLDGELTGAALKAAEAEIAADPSLSARLAALKAADARLRAAFSEPASEPIPHRLEALLRAQPLEPAAAGKPLKMRPPRLALAQLVSLAASLLVGVMVGRVLLTPADAPASYAVTAGGITVASAEVGRVLDHARTGKLNRAAGQTLAVRLTFQDGAGRYCREFQLGAGIGLACRGNDGWALEALASTRQIPSVSGYTMAQGPAVAELNAARDRIGVAEVLDVEGEAGAIASGWRKSSP